MGALGLLALFIRANFSLICNTPRDWVFPDRFKIKITISGGVPLSPRHDGRSGGPHGARERTYGAGRNTHRAQGEAEEAQERPRLEETREGHRRNRHPAMLETLEVVRQDGPNATLTFTTRGHENRLAKLKEIVALLGLAPEHTQVTKDSTLLKEERRGLAPAPKKALAA